MSFNYEVETETIRLHQSPIPIRIMVSLWEVVETVETTPDGSTTTVHRRVIQSWALPVTASRIAPEKDIE